VLVQHRLEQARAGTRKRMRERFSHNGATPASPVVAGDQPRGALTPALTTLRRAFFLASQASTSTRPSSRPTHTSGFGRPAKASPFELSHATGPAPHGNGYRPTQPAEVATVSGESAAKSQSSKQPGR
jgi:hypothetical protein